MPAMTGSEGLAMTDFYPCGQVILLQIEFAGGNARRTGTAKNAILCLDKDEVNN